MKKLAEEKTTHKTAMRLPIAMWSEIEDTAARAGHSANVEIIMRLYAYNTGVALTDIAQQNLKTQEMIQQIIDAIGPRPRR